MLPPEPHFQPWLDLETGIGDLASTYQLSRGL